MRRWKQRRCCLLLRRKSLRPRYTSHHNTFHIHYRTFLTTVTDFMLTLSLLRVHLTDACSRGLQQMSGETSSLVNQHPSQSWSRCFTVSFDNELTIKQQHNPTCVVNISHDAGRQSISSDCGSSLERTDSVDRNVIAVSLKWRYTNSLPFLLLSLQL